MRIKTALGLGDVQLQDGVRAGKGQERGGKGGERRICSIHTQQLTLNSSVSLAFTANKKYVFLPRLNLKLSENVCRTCEITTHIHAVLNTFVRLVFVCFFFSSARHQYCKKNSPSFLPRVQTHS